MEAIKEEKEKTPEQRIWLGIIQQVLGILCDFENSEFTVKQMSEIAKTCCKIRAWHEEDYSKSIEIPTVVQ